jgi:hypothetical protein
MSFFTILDAFKTTNSLTNAKKVAAHVRKHPMIMTMLTEDDAGMVREAERIVASVTPLAADTTCKLAEAADKAAKADKFREDMQAALRARFKNPNITVI